VAGALTDLTSRLTVSSTSGTSVRESAAYSQEFVLGVLRHEWPKFEAEGLEREGILGEVAVIPLSTSLGSTVSFPSGVRG